MLREFQFPKKMCMLVPTACYALLVYKEDLDALEGQVGCQMSQGRQRKQDVHRFLAWLLVPRLTISSIQLGSESRHPCPLALGAGPYWSQGTLWKGPSLCSGEDTDASQVSPESCVIPDTPNIPQGWPHPRSEMTIIRVTTAGGKCFLSPF